MVKRTYRHFSLIELLVVVGLMILLFGVVAPSFMKMLSLNRVDALASNLKLGLEQAQSRAVANRRAVAVILPYNPGNWNDDEVKRFCFGGWRHAFVAKSGDNWNFDGWVPGSAWGNQPQGAYLFEVGSSARTAGLGASTAGFFTSLSGAASKLLTVQNLPGIGTNVQTAVIFDKYGAVENDELFFTIAEGNRSDNDLMTPDQNNFVVLKLSKFTGKVEYVAQD